MITPEEALAKILAHVSPLPSRRVSLHDALGAFATCDLSAAFSLPRFDNSAMDGYAVVADSCAVKARLNVVGEQPAGIDRKLRVKRGEAIRIFTGAPIPIGADAVVMQEEVTVEGDEIVLMENVAAGEFIRRRGGDIAEGQKIFSAGEKIRPQMLPLLAAQGQAELEVGGAARVAIISTGDELTPMGASLQPGQIHDGNSVLLEGLLRSCGANVASIATCPDREVEIEQAVRAGIECDVLIISGGVSVGARDFVKQALNAVGATLDLWRVSVKPGKPFLFGHAGSCAIFGLPGNPVSAFVTFLLFVRPALLQMMGARASALELTKIPARLAESVENDGERPHYIRGILRDGTFAPVGRQESHALFGLSRSNALLLVRAGESILADATISALIWE